MSLNIAVCDDNSDVLELHKNLIKSIFQDKQINCSVYDFSTPQALLDSDIMSYNMVFLDIELNHVSGIELAKQILAENKDCFVFFITNYSIYLDSAFDIQAFRYLYKPIDKTRLCAGIDSALDKMRDATLKLTLTDFSTKLPVTINISSIIYIETNKHRSHVVTTQYNFITEQPISSLKAKIEQETDYFMTPHQSFYINLHFVTAYSKQDITLTYGKTEYKVFLTRRRYADFKKRLFLMAGELK